MEHHERSISRAEEVVERVGKENSGLLIGDEATSLYVAYLKAGGSASELGDVILARSNEPTCLAVMCDIIDAMK